MAKINNPPALGSDSWEDFTDEPVWTQSRAHELVMAMKNLVGTEDRLTLANGNDSPAVTVVKSKRPIQLLVCAWQVLVR